VIALGIESGRERQDFRGTEFHAETTCLAALDDDGNTTFGHDKTPTWGAQRHSRIHQKLWPLRPAAGVMEITCGGDVDANLKTAKLGKICMERRALTLQDTQKAAAQECALDT
jgi:hypothetical protein